MAETNSLQEHLGRVRLMAAGDPTWDLSENDMAALTAILSALTTTEQERDEAQKLLATQGQVIAEMNEYCARAESSLTAVQQERDALWEKAQALVAKLDEVHADEQYQAVWFTAMLHNGAYAGPNYQDELTALRATLTKEDKR